MSHRSEAYCNDPYCSDNPQAVRGTYEAYSGSICGIHEDAMQMDDEDEEAGECVHEEEA